jgi:hypothetical protein
MQKDTLSFMKPIITKKKKKHGENTIRVLVTWFNIFYFKEKSCYFNVFENMKRL